MQNTQDTSFRNIVGKTYIFLIIVDDLLLRNNNIKTSDDDQLDTPIVLNTQYNNVSCLSEKMRFS